MSKNDDHELDALLNARLLRAAAIDDASVARLPLSDVLDDLSGEIMRTPAPVVAPPAVPVTARRPMRRMKLVLAAAAAAAAVLVGTVVIPDGGGSRAFAAQAVAVAEANARLLVDKDRWNVTRVDEFTTEVGEMTFSDGKDRLDVHWAPRNQYKFHVDDRKHNGPGTPVTVLGAEGQLFTYSSNDFETVLPPQGEIFMYLRGQAADETAYRAILAALKTVDVDSWLSAMPESAVQPGQQDKAVEAMLRGVPLPAGFDRASVDTGGGVRDRYQLGAAVAGAVGCAWVELYDAALKRGDDAGARQAVDAMSSSHDWRVLRDMDEEGGYPEAFWGLADEMAGKTDERVREYEAKTGKDISLTEIAAGSLGCNS